MGIAPITGPVGTRGHLPPRHGVIVAMAVSVITDCSLLIIIEGLTGKRGHQEHNGELLMHLSH